MARSNAVVGRKYGLYVNLNKEAYDTFQSFRTVKSLSGRTGRITVSEVMDWLVELGEQKLAKLKTANYVKISSLQKEVEE